MNKSHPPKIVARLASKCLRPCLHTDPSVKNYNTTDRSRNTQGAYGSAE